jgi:serralysin
MLNAIAPTNGNPALDEMLWGKKWTDALAALPPFEHGELGDGTVFDTHYKWNPSTGELYVNGDGSTGRPTGNPIQMEIWDGGEDDMYDLSNFSSDVKIDLRPDHVSVFYVDDGTSPIRVEVTNAPPYDDDGRFLVESAKGGAGSDIIYGSQAKNMIHAHAGDDFIRGFENNDLIVAGLGNDTLDGGLGADSLTGNIGRDCFIFRTLEDSGLTSNSSDLILDFTHSNRDVIHLSNIDAVAGAGNQAFEFIGMNAFTHAGQVRYSFYKGDTSVWINTDSDKAAEMLIRLDGEKHLVASDFIL